MRECPLTMQQELITLYLGERVSSDHPAGAHHLYVDPQCFDADQELIRFGSYLFLLLVIGIRFRKP